jgi:hypothetical protein
MCFSKNRLLKFFISFQPSARPECDFTLDLPRAEALRLQLKREKRLRHYCRIFVYFLSFIFFILTVMIVSLLSTKGKRMFGSML